MHRKAASLPCGLPICLLPRRRLRRRRTGESFSSCFLPSLAARWRKRRGRRRRRLRTQLLLGKVRSTGDGDARGRQIYKCMLNVLRAHFDTFSLPEIHFGIHINLFLFHLAPVKLYTSFSSYKELTSTNLSISFCYPDYVRGGCLYMM